jgi:Cdc6-like AAA superfamily ATPase
MMFFKRNGKDKTIEEAQNEASKDPYSLGSLLASSGVPVEHIVDALDYQKEHFDDMLGKILVEKEVISQDFLDLILQKQTALRSGKTEDAINLLKTVGEKNQIPRQAHEDLRSVARFISNIKMKVNLKHG